MDHRGTAMPPRRRRRSPARCDTPHRLGES